MTDETKDKDKGKGFWKRMNRALTEVGIEHFDDDADWDQRVKLPAWQLEGIKARQEARQAAERHATEVKVDATLALRAYQHIKDHGQATRMGHTLHGVEAITDPDGYAFTLKDDRCSLRVLFHNQVAITSPGRAALQMFRNKLVAAAREG